MDTIFSCATGAWAPFQDPSATEDEPQQVLLLTERVNDWIGKETEAGRPPKFHSSKFETQERQMQRLLRRNNHILEDALKEWIEWVKWRETHKANDITEADFATSLKPLGIAEWRGQDKEGRPSIVLTGRLLRDGEYPRTISLFKKYAIFMAEQGVHMCNDKGVEHACILYDRRMLDFQHCDNDLHQGCKELFSEIRKFYGDRIGNVYILNMNWLFYSVFSFVLKPLVNLFGNNGGKLHAVQEPNELNEWFDEEHLLLNETHLENLNPDPVAYEQEDIEMDPAYGIKTRGVRLPGGMIITGLPEKPRPPKVVKLPTSEKAPTETNTPGTAL